MEDLRLFKKLFFFFPGKKELLKRLDIYFLSESEACEGGNEIINVLG